MKGFVSHMMGWTISMVIASFLAFVGIVYVNAADAAQTAVSRSDCHKQGGIWVKGNADYAFCKRPK